MRDMMKEIKRRLEAGEDLTLVTIVAASGSSPRGAGARMVVGREGRICGTIGGGIVEYRAQLMAQEILDEKVCMVHDFILHPDDVQKLGMVCGGEVKVYFRFLEANDPEILRLCEEAERLFEEGKDFWLIYDISNDGKMGLYSKIHGNSLMEISEWVIENCTRHPKRICSAEKEYYVEQIGSGGKVYVFGCGHVARELVPVLSHIGFRCIAMDDRAEFANKELFPTAEEVKICDFLHLEDYADITEDDYVCVMTRGHAYDTEIQAQMMRTPACYIGVIGSRHKIAAVQKELRTRGFTDKDFARVTTPIGLEIQAETPEEIAISIAGQMIQVRAKRNFYFKKAGGKKHEIN